MAFLAVSLGGCCPVVLGVQKKEVCTPVPRVPTGGPSLHCGGLGPLAPPNPRWDHTVTLADRGGRSALPWGCR